MGCHQKLKILITACQNGSANFWQAIPNDGSNFNCQLLACAIFCWLGCSSHREEYYQLHFYW